MKKQSYQNRLNRTSILVDIYSNKLSEGLGQCPKNPQGTSPLTHYRALPEPILAGRQEKGAVAPFLLDRIIYRGVVLWNRCFCTEKVLGHHSGAGTVVRNVTL